MNREIAFYEEVMSEMLAGAGGMLAVSAVVNLIEALCKRIKNDLSPEEAEKVLDDIIWSAEEIKKDLQKEQTT